MSKVWEWLLFAIIVIGGIGFIFCWYFGIPYLAYLIYDKIDYTAYLSIWLAIHLVRNIYGRIKVENEIKKYIELQKILGGK